MRTGASRPPFTTLRAAPGATGSEVDVKPWVCSLLLCLTVIGAASAEDDASLLPLAEGRRWTYDVKRTTQAAVVRTTDQGAATATCGAAETIDGRAYHRVTWRDEEQRERSAWVRADGSEVDVHRASDDRLPLLPARREPGRLEGVRVGGSTLTMTELVVRGVERVTTPHGEHEAVRVDATVTAPATRVRTSVWYAAGVGPVKVLEVVEAPATRVERELLLRSIEDGAAPASPGAAPDTGAAPTEPVPPASAGAPSSGRGLEALVTAAVGGDAAAVEALRALALEALRRAERAAGRKVAPAAWTWAERGGTQPRLGEGIEHLGGLDGAVVISAGDVEVAGRARGSVLIATGGVEVSGRVDDCLVLSLGDVDVAGNVEGCVVATRRDLDVAGALRAAVVQAREVDVSGRRGEVVEATDLLELLGR